MTAKLQLVLLALVFWLLFSLGRPAGANAPAPPPLDWLEFTRQEQPITPRAVQVLACEGPQCKAPRLLLRSGRCRAQGCVPGTPLLSTVSPAAEAKGLSFQCLGDRCLLAWLDSVTSDSRSLGRSAFRQVQLLVQVRRQVLRSPVWDLTPSSDFSLSDRVWRVQVGDQGLQVSPAETLRQRPWEDWTPSSAPGAFLLTLLVEGAIAVLYLRQRQADRAALTRTLVTIGVIHLFSFPIVWLSFPAFAPFTLLGTRVLGLMWLGLAGVYGLVATGARRVKTRTLVLGSIAFSLGAIVVALGVTLVFGYGRSVPLAWGLPYWWRLAVSEGLVVVYEAWLLSALSRERLSFEEAGKISLWANLASLLLGAMAIGLQFVLV